MRRPQSAATVLAFAATVAMSGAITLAIGAEAVHSAARDNPDRSFDLQGGFVVVLGAASSETLPTLLQCGAGTVQGLVPSLESAATIRDSLVERGLHGRATVEVLTSGHLPYADNLVNAVVVSDWCGVTPGKLFRVLAPRGRALVSPRTDLLSAMQEAGFTAGGQMGGEWLVFEKPWPQDIDEWTHFLHGDDGNAVSQDARIGPPNRLHWTAGPLYGRHHNRVSTLSAMVSARGMLFYILDDAPPGAADMPSRFSLCAQDAFNGLLLWRRPVAPWGWEAWSDDPLPEYGFGGKRSIGGRFTQPLQLPRTLVAGGGHLYATLGFGAPVSQIDIRTGKVLQTYRGTENTDEILWHDGTLVLAVHDEPIADKMAAAKQGREVSLGKHVLAVDCRDGRTLWQSESFLGVSGKLGFMDIHRNLNPAVGGGRVFLTAKESIVSLDLDTGKTVWQAPRPAFPEQKTRYDLRTTDMVTLVWHDGRVFFAQLEPDRRIDWRQTFATLYAYSADDGAPLWKRHCASWGWGTPPDVWVIDRLVWVADRSGQQFVGLDPASGAVRREVSCEQAFDQDHHHRCYRNKATSHYLLTSFHGLDLFDVAGDAAASVQPWVRSVCRYGFLPANGMIYNAPDHCGCYPNVKLTGFNALVSADTAGPEDGVGGEQRVWPGPVGFPEAGPPAADDWPAFRHDCRRTGIASCELPSDIARSWTTSLGGVPTAATIAAGRVYVAVPDLCLVVCLDAATGRRIWTRAVGSRVDTPPTCYRGTVVFGSADGEAYCLRAADGQAVWQFDAAPERRLIMADGMVESAWPVHGSVVVERDRAYVVAGRSSYLDGGFAAWVLDAATGRVLSHRTLGGDAGFLGMRLGTSGMPGVKTDLLVSDGASLFMRDEAVFADVLGKQDARPRMATLAGFLDDSLFNRTSQWRLGKLLLGDYAIADESWAFSWQLYAKRTSGDQGFFQPGTGDCRLLAYRDPDADVSKPSARRGRQKASPPLWTRDFPVVVRAMLKAGGVLCVAGTPDVVPENDPWRVYEGRGPGVLALIDVETGRDLAEHALASPPVYHGLSAAGGRLFLSCKNGDVTCFAPRD